MGCNLFGKQGFAQKVFSFFVRFALSGLFPHAYQEFNQLRNVIGIHSSFVARPPGAEFVAIYKSDAKKLSNYRGECSEQWIITNSVRSSSSE
jgi:hypothetical protein